MLTKTKSPELHRLIDHEDRATNPQLIRLAADVLATVSVTGTVRRPGRHGVLIWMSVSEPIEKRWVRTGMPINLWGSGVAK